MDILSPINQVSETGPLREAGATEVYCGLMRHEMKKKFTNVFALNSRHVEEANLSDYDELEKLCTSAHGLGMKVFVTYNALYNEHQLDALLPEVARSIECGADALIVADISLMLILKELHPKTPIVISTFAGAFNSASCNLFKNLGAKRITLPRNIGPEQAKKTAALCPKMDFEIFIMSERCYFPNALCKFEHATYRVGGPLSVATSVAEKLLGRNAALLTGTYNNRIVNSLQDKFVASKGMMCCREYEADLVDTEGNVLDTGLPFRFVDIWNSFREACGLCSLYDFGTIPNVVSAKVVGRQSITSKKVKETKMVRRAIELLEQGLSREEYAARVKEIRKESYPFYCGKEYCYYNES